MTTTFDQHLTEDRRLVTLRVLAHSSGYQVNEYTLEAVLDDSGHSVSNAQVRTDLAWLAEQQLIDTRMVGGVTIATLTRRGLDVAQGKAEQPGVKRPQPD
jgi:Fe2+ or Zn2+ uptake regulation protein